LTAESASECDWAVVSEYPQRPGVYEEEASDLTPVSGKIENQEMWKTFLAKSYDMMDTVNLGIRGTYGTSFFIPTDSEDSRYLRSQIQREYDIFLEDMEKKGRGIKGITSDDISGVDESTYTDVSRIMRLTVDGELLGQIYFQRLNLLFWVHSQPWKGLAVHYVKCCFMHCAKFLECILIVYLQKENPNLPAQIFFQRLLQPLKELLSGALSELERIEADRKRSTKGSSILFLPEIKRLQEPKRKSELHLENQQWRADLGRGVTPSAIAENHGSDSRKTLQKIEIQEIINEMLIYYKVCRDPETGESLYVTIINADYRLHKIDSLRT
jgi:hypothetical protein